MFAISGAYWLSTPSGPVQTTCDMDNGGWTLIGENGGYDDNKYMMWLRHNFNTQNLASGTQIETGNYSCIDAVNIAVYHATKVTQKQFPY